MMKIPDFIRSGSSPYSLGPHVGYLNHFFNDLIFNREIPKAYEDFMRQLTYTLFIQYKAFEHSDLIKFLNNPPSRDKFIGPGYMSSEKFYEMIIDSQVQDFFNSRLNYLMDCPDPPCSFNEQQYELMQCIQDSAYFVSVFHKPDWIPYSIESKYTLIGYLLLHEWVDYGFQTNCLEEEVETLIIALKNPVVKGYNKLELLLSLPNTHSEKTAFNVVRNFVKQKPTAQNLLHVLKLN